MKRFAILILALILNVATLVCLNGAASFVSAQVQPPSTYVPQLVTYNAAPFGTCTPDQVALNVATGDFYSCNPSTHTWRATGTNLLSSNNTLSGQNTFTQPIVSSVNTGTAPLSVVSTTLVSNLNAALHGGLSAPTSAIVGVSDSQALTNKSFTGASNGNTVFLLNAQTNAGAITGNNSAQTVYTYTLPANTVGNLKGIRVTAGFQHTGSNNATYTLSLNGVSVSSVVNGTAGTGELEVATILNTGATTGTGTFNYEASNTGGSAGVSTLTGLAWSSNQTLLLTFNAAATETVAPTQWIVELIQ